MGSMASSLKDGRTLSRKISLGYSMTSATTMLT
jgi:hypothetical protein